MLSKPGALTVRNQAEPWTSLPGSHKRWSAKAKVTRSTSKVDRRPAASLEMSSGSRCSRQSRSKQRRTPAACLVGLQPCLSNPLHDSQALTEFGHREQKVIECAVGNDLVAPAEVADHALANSRHPRAPTPRLAGTRRSRWAGRYTSHE